MLASCAQSPLLNPHFHKKKMKLIFKSNNSDKKESKRERKELKYFLYFLGGLGHIGSPNNLVSHLLGSPSQVKTQKVRGRLAWSHTVRKGWICDLDWGHCDSKLHPLSMLAPTRAIHNTQLMENLPKKKVLYEKQFYSAPTVWSSHVFGDKKSCMKFMKTCPASSKYYQNTPLESETPPK